MNSKELWRHLNDSAESCTTGKGREENGVFVPENRGKIYLIYRQ